MYDVIGIQSHMHGGTWSNDKIWQTCERFARFGKPLHFTEATILSGQLGWRSDGDRRPWPSTPEGERYQAREVERFYTMLFSHPAVEAITWWDFSDNGSWKRAPAGFVRHDMSPKPAYEALQRLIKQKWWTKTMATSGADGQARFRGFRGQYKVTVTVPGKNAVTQVLSLDADDATLRVVVP
jgi:endo-1,4-beta-xylanase